MRMVLFLSSFLLVPILLFGWLLWSLNTVTSHYATYEDAVADDLFDRGWLPDFIPASATGIVTNNDLDHDISYGEFYYDPADTSAFLRNLRPYRGGKTPFVDYPGSVAEMEADGYRAWEYMNTGLFWVFFVNSEEGHVIYDMWPNKHRPPEGAAAPP